MLSVEYVMLDMPITHPLHIHGGCYWCLTQSPWALPFQLHAGLTFKCQILHLFTAGLSLPACIGDQKFRGTNTPQEQPATNY